MSDSLPRILFLHGGPGLHSEAERRALTAPLSARGLEITFWDEPSALRGPAPASGDGFKVSLASANDAVESFRGKSGRPVHLVAHSFGSVLALALIRRDPTRFASLTLVNPMLNVFEGLSELVARAARDARAGGQSELADALERSLSRSHSARDAELRGALARAFEFPGILGYYWRNQAALGEWGAVMAEPAFGIDWERQASVLSTLPEPGDYLGSGPLGVRTQMIFGAHDRVSSLERELPTISALAGPTAVIDMNESAHFPHLEEKEKFADALRAFVHASPTEALLHVGR